MPMRVDLYHDTDKKVLVYEEMIDGKSYMFIRMDHDVMQIPAAIWRKINTAWQEKGWEEKWDSIDTCPPILEI